MLKLHQRHRASSSTDERIPPSAVKTFCEKLEGLFGPIEMAFPGLYTYDRVDLMEECLHQVLLNLEKLEKRLRTAAQKENLKMSRTQLQTIYDLHITVRQYFDEVASSDLWNTFRAEVRESFKFKCYAELGRLLGEFSKLTDQKYEKESEILKLEVELTDLNKISLEKNGAVTESRAAVDNLSDQISSLEAKYTNLKGISEKFVADIHELENTIPSLKTEVHELRETV